MAAACEKHSPVAASDPVIHLLSNSESDSSDWLASGGHAKRKNIATKPRNKVLPDGFRNPLQSSKSKKRPKTCGNKNGFKLHESGDVKRLFLLKLLKDHNQPVWRKNGIWLKEAWDKICQAFNERFLDEIATKPQLQDRVYEMKKTYKVLKQLSELSGLTWDHTKTMLKGPDHIWQKLLHTNKDAKKWYKKSWPYYSTFEELFAGKSVIEKQSSGVDESCEVTKPVRISQNITSLQEQGSEGGMERRERREGERGMEDRKREREGEREEREEEVEINMNCPRPSLLPQHSTQKARAQMNSCTESSFMKKTARLANDKTDFSIKTCIEVFYKLNGFTTTDLFKVGRIFRSIENREMFMSLKDEDKELWLRAEIDADL